MELKKKKKQNDVLVFIRFLIEFFNEIFRLI